MITSFKQIAVVLCCVAITSFSSQPSGGSAGSLSAATATAAAVATAAAHNSDSKTLKDAVENPAIVKLTEENTPARIAFSPNSKRAAVLYRRGQRLFDLFNVDEQTGRFTRIEGEFPMVGYSRELFYVSDDFFIVCENKVVNLYDSLGNKRKILFQKNESQNTYSMPPRLSIATCPSKSLVALADNVDRTLSVYRFDAKTLSLLSLVNIPFAAKDIASEMQKTTFSPSGNFIALVSNKNSISFYAFDSAQGTLTSIQGSPVDAYDDSLVAFAPNDTLCLRVQHDQVGIRIFSLDRIQGITEQAGHFASSGSIGIAISPDGRFAVNTNAKKGTIYAIDNAAKTLRPIDNFAIAVRTSEDLFAYSPSGDIAAIVNTSNDSIAIYEIDRATGKFTPLTGGLLQSEIARRAMVLAREVLVDHGPLVHGIIARYFGAIYDNAPAAASIEEVTEADGAIAKTKEESDSKRIQETRVQLFQAIAKARSNDVASLLTPFTINARDEENRTALMHAVRHSDTDSIVEQLLKYKGEKQYSLHSKEAVEVDLNAVDYDGNTALIYAIKNNRFKAACTLAQKMSKEIIAKANKKKETALSLAQEEKVRTKYAGGDDYKALMKLLEQ